MHPMAQAQVDTSSNRLEALDGLRCIAVLAVMLYHYLWFWTSAGRGENIVAYDAAFSSFPFAAIGGLGVNLFFVISGFVILMTLERTSTLAEFAVRRFVRLWPPIVLFGTFTFVFINLNGPAALAVSVPEYLISLLFVPPQHVGGLLGATGWTWLDGAYWSLWVEVRFYAVVGAFYFLMPGNFIRRWTLFECATLTIGVANVLSGIGALDKLDGLVFQKYVPYFSLGLASYLSFTARAGPEVKRLMWITLTHLGFTMAVYVSKLEQWDAMFLVQYGLGQAAILYVFYRLMWRRDRMRWLEAQPLVRMGQASYGTYLLHQNVGLSLLALPIFATVPFAIGGIVMVSLLVIGVSMLSYDYFERPVQRYLLGIWKRRWLTRADTKMAVIGERKTD